MYTYYNLLFTQETKFEEFVNADNNLRTKSLNETNNVTDVELDESDEENNVILPPTCKEITDAFNTLANYMKTNNVNNFFSDYLHRIKFEYYKNNPANRKQSHINDFFPQI